MNRSGYSDEGDSWTMIRWRGAVKSSIRGKKGQIFLKKLLVALESTTVKELIKEDLELDGRFCALGVLGKDNGVDLTKINYTDYEILAETFGISQSLAREVMYENDEGDWRESDKARYTRMLGWVKNNIENGERKVS